MLDKLPEEWYIVVTQENIQCVGELKFQTEDRNLWPSDFRISCVVGKTKEYHLYEWDRPENSKAAYWKNEISYNDFRRLVLKQDVTTTEKEDMNYLIDILNNLKNG
jgi:hypothetical protein